MTDIVIPASPASYAWVSGLALPLPFDSAVDYVFKLTAWLAGATLTAATVEAVGCTAGAPVVATPNVTVRVSAAGPNAKLTIKATASDGRVGSFPVYFNPEPSTCCA